MSIITGPQAARLGRPPRPPPQDVRIVEPDGKPTRIYYDYLVALDEWYRRLYTILTE